MRRTKVKGIVVTKMSQSNAPRLPGSQIEHCKLRTKNKQCSVTSDVTEKELDQEGQATCVQRTSVNMFCWQHGALTYLWET